MWDHCSFSGEYEWAWRGATWLVCPRWRCSELRGARARFWTWDRCSGKSARLGNPAARLAISSTSTWLLSWVSRERKSSLSASPGPVGLIVGRDWAVYRFESRIPGVGRSRWIWVFLQPTKIPQAARSNSTQLWDHLEASYLPCWLNRESQLNTVRHRRCSTIFSDSSQCLRTFSFICLSTIAQIYQPSFD